MAIIKSGISPLYEGINRVWALRFSAGQVDSPARGFGLRCKCLIFSIIQEDSASFRNSSDWEISSRRECPGGNGALGSGAT
jgi:hypothetical protein